MAYYKNRFVFVLLLAFFQSISNQSNKYFITPLNLFVGDGNSSQIFRATSNNKQLIGVLFTNKHCKQCWNDQRQLFSLIEKIWRQYKVKIYRCELSSSNQLQQQFHIKRFPMLHFVIPQHQSYKIYHSSQLVLYKSAKVVIERLKRYLKGENINQKNNLFINEERLFFIEDDQLINLYGLNPIFQNLPLLSFKSSHEFVRILQQDLVQDHELTTCSTYYQKQHKCFNPGSIQEIQLTFSLINFEQVMEFTEKTYKFYEQLALNRYIFIAVLDSILNRQKSREYLQLLNDLMQRRQFKNKISIFWMEVQINRQKLVHLGFKQMDNPPLFSLFSLGDGPKTTLTDQKGPIFNEKQIVKFIKNILKFDEKVEVQLWNKELLLQSLNRLKLSTQYQLVSDRRSISQNPSFLLSISYVEYELLGDHQIFYKMMLNYHFLMERINRFAQRRIAINYLIFEESGTLNRGFFLYLDGLWNQLTSKIIFEPEEISTKLIDMFNLPQLFWVHQDYYEEYVTQNQFLSEQSFNHVLI